MLVFGTGHFASMAIVVTQNGATNPRQELLLGPVTVMIGAPLAPDQNELFGTGNLAVYLRSFI